MDGLEESICGAFKLENDAHIMLQIAQRKPMWIYVVSLYKV